MNLQQRLENAVKLGHGNKAAPISVEELLLIVKRMQKQDEVLRRMYQSGMIRSTSVH